mmetsp:Transcript_13318/g.18037  ORF Transcript_13318/g.18037 Transcript_13318/m.18037 type:complete len:99 (-) Transcript_13318:22-318(-)
MLRRLRDACLAVKKEGALLGQPVSITQATGRTLQFCAHGTHEQNSWVIKFLYREPATCGMHSLLAEGPSKREEACKKYQRSCCSTLCEHGSITHALHR